MEFKIVFDKRLEEIKSSVNHQNSSSEDLLKSIDGLQNLVKAHLGSLSTFDQEKYDAKLQNLRTEVWTKSRPKKFKFKSSRMNKDLTALKSTDKINNTDDDTVNTAKSIPTPSSTESINSLPKQSVSQILESPQKNLNLNDLKDSVIIAPEVSSSLYMNKCEDSTIFVNCQQCRIHECKNITIYIENCRHPVIESSESIRFIISADLKASVHDFSWMNPASPNPHFSITYIDPAAWKPIKLYNAQDFESQRALRRGYD